MGRSSARSLAALEKAGLRAKAETRKSAAGRKPLDGIVMFKVLVLQSLYNLSDDEKCHRIPDPRPAFVHAVSRAGPGRHGAGRQDHLAVPRGLAKDETAKALFEAFGAHLKEQGYLAMTPGEWRSKAPCEISSAAIVQFLA